MTDLSEEFVQQFLRVVRQLEQRLGVSMDQLADQNVESGVRQWLDGGDAQLEWDTDGITPDEWFFITTLYGTMTLEGQRTHIRSFFPLFKSEAQGKIANLSADVVKDWKLRSPWMKRRLCKMAEILKERTSNMWSYAEWLREKDSLASPQNPMPAVDTILKDHGATEGKTLSVFVRDCIKGNCFPIDSRVEKVLQQHNLPNSEHLLVAACLALELNPRQTARLFYEVGGAD